MRYLKIGSIIFKIDLCEDSNNFELDDRIINPEYALYQTNTIYYFKLSSCSK